MSDDARAIDEDAFVSVTRLRVRYGAFTAVDNISFDIPRGAIFGFIGPNGAGKSSTIRVLATLQPPDGGRVRIAGCDLHREPQAIRRRIGYVPDRFGCYEDLTVFEYLAFFAAAYRLPVKKRRQIIDDALALTELERKRFDQVDGLSRGMQQRLAVARVLLHDPEFLLLDEPASGLDPRARIELRELLKELQGMGKTILISSHILHELAQLCSDIAIIEAGQLLCSGNLQAILRTVDLQRRIYVQLVEPPADARARIADLPGVIGVDEEIDRLCIRVDEEPTAIEDLHDRLVGLGLRLRMFQAEAVDMETAFMKLTSGKTA